MVMQERTLEINVISAQNLKKVKKYGHQACYVVAYINSRDKKASKVDKEGGLNPKWNAKLTLTCDDKLLQRGGKYITVDVYSFGTFRNKLVGSSRISLLDIGRQVATAAPPKLLSFEVQRCGMVHGALNVTVSVVQEKKTTFQKSHSGMWLFSFPKNYRRQHAQITAPTSVPTGRPMSPWQNTEAFTHRPPPKVNSEPGVANAVYPPHRSTSSKMDVPVKAYPVSGYLPTYPASGYLPAYPLQQYGPQNGTQSGGQLLTRSQRSSSRHSSSHSVTQATAPFKSQQIHYSKPARRQGGNKGGNSSSRMGTGLVGGVLGGSLLGDMIGDIF